MDLGSGPPWTFFQPSFMLSYISFLLSCVRILLNGKKFITRTPYFSVPCIEADKLMVKNCSQMEGMMDLQDLLGDPPLWWKWTLIDPQQWSMDQETRQHQGPWVHQMEGWRILSRQPTLAYVSRTTRNVNVILSLIYILSILSIVLF